MIQTPRIIFTSLVTAAVATPVIHAVAEAKLVVSVVEETWIGRIEKKSDTEIEFVSVGQRYEIAGLLEKYMVKDDGKERQITGRLTEGHVIEVSKVQPPPAVK